jgi:hypothetical protein
MKRQFLLLLAALATGLVLVVSLIRIIAGMPGAQPAGWQSAAQAYMRYQATRYAIRLEILAAEEAARPWGFRPGMSSRSFGESTYYQVSTPYSGVNGAMPLPMPPVAVWCVRLKVASDTSGPAARFVFVAKHQSLYNADWITHESPGESAQPPAEILAQIGCSFP